MYASDSVPPPGLWDVLPSCHYLRRIDEISRNGNFFNKMSQNRWRCGLKNLSCPQMHLSLSPTPFVFFFIFDINVIGFHDPGLAEHHPVHDGKVFVPRGAVRERKLGLYKAYGGPPSHGGTHTARTRVVPWMITSLVLYIFLFICCRVLPCVAVHGTHTARTLYSRCDFYVVSTFCFVFTMNGVYLTTVLTNDFFVCRMRKIMYRLQDTTCVPVRINAPNLVHS